MPWLQLLKREQRKRKLKANWVGLLLESRNRMRDKYITKRVKTRIFITVVLSMMAYGTFDWVINKKVHDKINVTKTEFRRNNCKKNYEKAKNNQWRNKKKNWREKKGTLEDVEEVTDWGPLRRRKKIIYWWGGWKRLLHGER